VLLALCFLKFLLTQAVDSRARENDLSGYSLYVFGVSAMPFLELYEAQSGGDSHQVYYPI
jgi:hypothetical protein